MSESAANNGLSLPDGTTTITDVACGANHTLALLRLGPRTWMVQSLGPARARQRWGGLCTSYRCSTRFPTFLRGK
ncbi:uncharacterized protein B0H18DRAFT_1006388, partial [Fomitopsis serialis]|uniref:uncharacterized protein n=1 Tax=Fomitopsis serialis TaxID=139415 RepID=UPI00200769AF